MISADLPPIDRAARSDFAEFGHLVATNTALKISVLVLAGVIGLLGFQCVRLSKEVVARKPLVVRIDKVGKAEAVGYRYDDYTPQDAEIRYFLNQFVVDFYSRDHRTLRDYYPASLYYLSDSVFAHTEAQDRRTRWAAKFLNSADDDVDIVVHNIALDEGRKPLYVAQVQAEKVYTTSSGTEEKRRPFVATIYFKIDPLRAAKNPDMVAHNPLGFSITSLRADEAFSQ